MSRVIQDLAKFMSAAPAAPAGEPAPAWQPIETAPKDGTVIMLGRPGDEADGVAEISTPGRWIEGYGDGPDDMGHNDGFMDLEYQQFRCPRLFGAEKYRTDGNQPTHWMPIPAAPASPKG